MSYVTIHLTTPFQTHVHIGTYTHDDIHIHVQAPMTPEMEAELASLWQRRAALLDGADISADEDA
jgi:hypothetical protein